MKSEGRQGDGGPRTRDEGIVLLVQDVRARIVRLLEALADGEYELAVRIAEDLEVDLRGEKVRRAA